MDIKKFKVIAYVMYRRLQGYKLLRNAPGTPWTYVKMLNSNGGLRMSYLTADTCQIYNTISADFSGPKITEKKEQLTRQNYVFFDEVTSEFKYHKSLRYYRFSPLPVIRKEKYTIDPDIVDARNLDFLDKVASFTLKGYVPTTDNGISVTDYDYQMRRTVRAYLIDKYADKLRKDRTEERVFNRIFNQNILRTLYHNLSR